MNLLMVGGGKGGSWQIRGQQLGIALGARVVNVPSEADWRWADLAVLVKRAGMACAAQARQHGVPIVWDALDFWAQPGDNAKDQTAAMRLLQAHMSAIQPAHMIGATRAMAAAVGGTYLSHHCWPGLAPIPPRRTVQVVGYQGNALYLGAWRGRLEAACQRRGWSFVINPERLTDADILVALREGPWDGWMCREWKSGVKVVNAMAAGRPLVTQDSAAVRELQPMRSEVAVPDDLDAAFDAWTAFDRREKAYAVNAMRAESFSLAATAARYRDILTGVRDQCAA